MAPSTGMHQSSITNRGTQLQIYGEGNRGIAIHALSAWKLYLFKHFDLFKDSQGVTYLPMKSGLTKTEAQWCKFLADFDVPIHHLPGKDNIANGLSRRPRKLPESANQQGTTTTYVSSSSSTQPPGAETVLSGLSVTEGRKPTTSFLRSTWPPTVRRRESPVKPNVQYLVKWNLCDECHVGATQLPLGRGRKADYTAADVQCVMLSTLQPLTKGSQ